MQYDRVLINGLPLPNVFVLPIGATFKIIEPSARRCECGPVHKGDCWVAAADASVHVEPPIVHTDLVAAWLDSIALGVGFYQVPNEALASRDPDRSSPDKLPGDVHSDHASG